MLKKIQAVSTASAGLPISSAEFPSPFPSKLEYSCPARGTWNIVHTGMLIPEAHQIFVCAAGCLRGVVLTAAEMGAEERFSTIEIRENNILDGDMEELITDGIDDILDKLEKKPPAVLVYTSCIHHFIGCDLKHVYETLRKRHPDVYFTDCYMNPIMRKSGLNPDQLMRRQLYSLLQKQTLDNKSINIIGNDFKTSENSELVRLIKNNGYTLREITDCETYAEYEKMGSSSLNISYYPAAKAAGDYLEHKLGQKHLYLPLSFSYDEIVGNLNKLRAYMGLEDDDFKNEIIGCEMELEKLKEQICDTEIAIDYTLTPRPLGLARLLLSHKLNVKRIYLDSINGEEKDDYEFLKNNYGDVMLYPTVDVSMRSFPRTNVGKILALGQKAAYFTGSDYFVNIVEGGGLYGFDGINELIKLISEAYIEPKNAQKLIQIKGLGCK